MDEITLDTIKDDYNSLNNDTNEANITIKIVYKFLSYLGYEDTWIDFQTRIDMKNTSDIFIKSPNGNKLIVEVKAKNHHFNVEDKKQITRYLDGEVVEWGILTNGNEYLLINHFLSDININDRYCLKYYLNSDKLNYAAKAMNNIFLNYFTYDYIFNKNASNYFAEFQRFKVKSLTNSKKISISQYESANFNFFNYIANNVDGIVDLNDLNTRYLIRYFNDYLAIKDLKPNSVINKYRYIKSFVDFLEKNELLKNKNDFKKLTEDSLLKHLNLVNNDIKIEPVSKEEIALLLDYLKKDNLNGLRNVLLLKLICYIPLDVETIINIKHTDLQKNKDNKTYKIPYVLNVNNLNITLSKSISTDLAKYLDQRKKNNVKIPYLFYANYTIDNKRVKKLSVSLINRIISLSFNEIESIDESRRKVLNYALLKASVIKNLYAKGLSLEELCSLTGLNIASIYNSLDEKQIKLKTKSLNGNLLKYRPFSNIL